MNVARGPIYTPVELLARLVAFDTTSHRSNLGLIAFVEDYLLQHGVRSRRIVSERRAERRRSTRPSDPRANAVSRSLAIPTSFRSMAKRGPAIPLRCGPNKARLYGRGAADMKGFLAAVLAAVPDFKRRRLETPIHLAFSYDEEIGCVGVRPMIAELGKVLPKPRMVIVGEPTSMQVVDAHKGPVRWRVDVKGRAAHSSMATLGVNAITYAARLVGEIERIEAGLKRTARNERFKPPYPTLQVTETRRRNGNQYHSCCLRFRLRDPRAARSRSGCDRSAVAALRRDGMPA